jgi:hypothetical protein
MKFRKRAVVVDAVQLLPSTWVEMAELTRGDNCENCYVDVNGAIIEGGAEQGRIGMTIPSRDPELVELAVEGDWVVREVSGDLAVYPDREFREQFESPGDGDRRSALVSAALRAARTMRDATRNALSELEEAGAADTWARLDEAIAALDRYAEGQVSREEGPNDG